MPYITRERIIELKKRVRTAVKNHKIFTISGGYNGIRKALFKRGWLEKPLNSYYSGSYHIISSPSVDQLLQIIPRKPLGIDETEYVKNVENFVICQLLQRHDPDFYWNVQVPESYWRRYKNRKPFKNRFPFSYFTCKSGLCNTLYQMYWYYRPGVSETLLPRCYHSFYYEQMEAFIQDYRLTACMSLLKKCLSQLENLTPYDPHNDEKSLPFHIIQFAIDRCYDYIAFKTHEDIDKAPPHVTISQWNEFFKFHQLFAHLRGKFINHKAKDINVWKEKINDVLGKIKPFWPQYDIDGMLNLWIVKPGNSCRGQGIRILSDNKEIMSAVQRQKNVVVQKYIECPFLIHETKFDIRQWFLVTSVNPLVVWIYKASYLRFSGYKYDLKNLHESIHLTNHAVQCHYPISVDRDSSLPKENMWPFHIFKTYLLWQGHADKWDEVIFPGMKKAIAGVMLASQMDMTHVDNCFQLYGADFIIDQEFRPWLLEVNLCPDMSGSTSVTSRLCAECFDDIIKVVVDCNETTLGDSGLFELVLREEYEECSKDLDLNVEGFKLPIHPLTGSSKPSSQCSSIRPNSSISLPRKQDISCPSFNEQIGDTYSERSIRNRITFSSENMESHIYKFIPPSKLQPKSAEETKNIPKPKRKKKKDSNLLNKLSSLRNSIEQILEKKYSTHKIRPSTRTSLLKIESMQLLKHSDIALNKLITLSEECEKIKQNKGENIFCQTQRNKFASNEVQKSCSLQFTNKVQKKFTNKNLANIVKSIRSQLHLVLEKSSSGQTKCQQQDVNFMSDKVTKNYCNQQNLGLKMDSSDDTFLRLKHANNSSMSKSIFKSANSEPLVKITKNFPQTPVTKCSTEKCTKHIKTVKIESEEILNPTVVHQLKKLNSMVNTYLVLDSKDKSKSCQAIHRDVSDLNFSVKVGQSDNLYKAHLGKTQKNSLNNSTLKKHDNYFMEGDESTLSNDFISPFRNSYTQMSGDTDGVRKVTEYEREKILKISRKYVWLFTIIKNELCWITHGIEWDSFICPFIKNEFIKALLTQQDNFHIYGKDIILKFEYPIMEVDPKHYGNISTIALQCPQNLLDLMSAVISRKYMQFISDDWFHNLKTEFYKIILIDEVLKQSKIIKYEKRIRMTINKQIGYLLENVSKYFLQKKQVENNDANKFWVKAKNDIKNRYSNDMKPTVATSDEHKLNISPSSSDQSLEFIDDDIKNLRITLQNMVIPKTASNYDNSLAREEEYNLLRYISKQKGLKRDMNRLKEVKTKNMKSTKKETKRDIKKTKNPPRVQMENTQKIEKPLVLFNKVIVKAPEKIISSPISTPNKLEVITENVTLKFKNKNSVTSIKGLKMKKVKSTPTGKNTNSNTNLLSKSKSQSSVINKTVTSNYDLKNGNLLRKLSTDEYNASRLLSPVDESKKLVKDFFVYRQFVNNSVPITNDNIFCKNLLRQSSKMISDASSSNFCSRNHLNNLNSDLSCTTAGSSSSTISSRTKRKYTMYGIILPPKSLDYFAKFTLNYKKPKPTPPILVTAADIQARKQSFMALQIQKRKLDREVRLENKQFYNKNRKRKRKNSKSKEQFEVKKKKKYVRKKCKKSRLNQPTIKDMINETKAVIQKPRPDTFCNECGIIEEV